MVVCPIVEYCAVHPCVHRTPHEREKMCDNQCASNPECYSCVLVGTPEEDLTVEKLAGNAFIMGLRALVKQASADGLNGYMVIGALYQTARVISDKMIRQGSGERR